MAVAKSFQKYEIVTEPYVNSGRLYVKVRNPQTGSIRQVRWYTEAEYKKLYGEPSDGAKIIKTQKEALGFQKGYVTVFKGDTFPYLEWFKQSIARYCKWWGWYIVSTDELPTDIPKDLTPIMLPWDAVGTDSGCLRTDKEVTAAVDAIMYDESASVFIGKIGERIEVTLTVKRVIELNGSYGAAMMHVMEDEDGNVYVWTTAAKTLITGNVYKMRGTIKDHRVYRNTKQTILNRCIEVK